MIVLGIETSCDETAAAVVKDGGIVMSSVVASQADSHHRYGGVVPEIASRLHIDAVSRVVEAAVEKAGVSVDRIEGIAATRGPGLIGSLLVGFSFAKAFAYARRLEMAGVNHLEGHIHSSFLCDTPPDFPFIALVASGGHTNIYHVRSYRGFELMGQTRDDAVGEAFDKVAKMMGLGYPGGPVIESMALKGDPGRIEFPRTYLEKGSFDFSFSGLKSAVARYLAENKESLQDLYPHIAAGFQAAVFDVLIRKLVLACEEKRCGEIAVTGGVAANSSFCRELSRRAGQSGLAVHVPPGEYCGDNAAMIAARGYHQLLDHEVCLPGDDVFSRNRV
ncbi:MAG: tRNA (adenosine(37)-N6)-threonylcarbamoyltransferase complex transferase subunit TsaD [Desulfobacteraceae bacterium]